MDYVVIAAFALWAVLLIVKRLRARKGALETLLFLAVSGVYVADEFAIYHIIDSGILSWVVYGGLAISVFFFKPEWVIPSRVKSDRYERLKKEHIRLEGGFESLRKRFIATIELMRDGMMFRTDDGEMFLTDRLLSVLGETENATTQKAFEKHIHPDDIHGVKDALERLTKKHPGYAFSYRYRTAKGDIWIKERGKLIHYEGKKMIIATAETLDVKRYPHSEVDLLNSMRIDHELPERLQGLNRHKEPYYLVFFELSNIPAINRRYGRDIGDLMMGEFLNKLRYHFVREEHTLYRVTGIRFAMIIRDDRKYQILDRALKHGGDLLNFEMKFGGVEENVYPHFGIQRITMFEEPVDEVIARTTKALDIAMSEDTHENYFVIG